jgi:hypothetical protein
MSLNAKFVALAASTLMTFGCVSIPDTYAPPVQRKPLAGPDPSSLRPYVRMNDSGAEAHLIRDVNLNVEGSGFRWTKQNPTFIFQPRSADGQKLKLDFTLHPEVVTKIGAITLTILINNKLFDKITYGSAGVYHYEKAVPPGYLVKDGPAFVGIELDKVLDTPDGNKLGLVLNGAGFAG